MHCGVEVTESSTNKQDIIIVGVSTKLGLSHVFCNKLERVTICYRGRWLKVSAEHRNVENVTKLLAQIHINTHKDLVLKVVPIIKFPSFQANMLKAGIHEDVAKQIILGIEYDKK